jgi:hypothetical protein
MRLIILSNGFAGHRRVWLESLIEATRNTENEILLIVVTGELSMMSTWGRPFTGANYRILFAKSKKNAIALAEQINTTPGTNNLVFWDADKWIHYLFLQNLPCRALFLRYEIDRSNAATFLKSSLKKFLINVLNSTRNNVDVRYLQSPFLVNSNKKVGSLSDDLIVHLLRSTAENHVLENYKDSQISFITPGFITWRKRPDLIVDYLATFGNYVYDKPCKFVLCGSIDPEVTIFLSKHLNKGIDILNGYLDYSEYLNVLKNATAILLPYDDLGSSNILTEAIFLGVPVVIKKSPYWDKLDIAYKHLVYESDFEPHDLRKKLSNILANERVESRREGKQLPVFEKSSMYNFFCKK